VVVTAIEDSPMSRSVVAVVISLSVISPASARAVEGDNAILVTVSHVDIAKKLPGICQVDAKIDTVLQGKTFHPGDMISLHVPCGAHTSVMPLPPAVENHDAQLIDPRVLLAAKTAGAHLDDAGNLLWTPTARSFGTVGHIWGYRILDGRLLPAEPTRFSR